MLRRTITRLGAGPALLLLAACGSSGGLPGAEALAGFEPGAARADVIAALPPGDLTPTSRIGDSQLDHGYLIDQYLVEGETVEVLWVHDPALGLPTEDFREHLTPVVFRGGVLDGVGWDHLDQRMADWGIPDPWAEPAAASPADNPVEMTSF